MLLIPRVGIDIVSDVTTNIIRGPLIEYTQEQCRQLEIPLVTDVPSGPMWHPARREWVTQFVDLPMTTTGKLLLVPKAIVRRTSLYSMQEYYRHYMLEHMQREELKAGSALVTMLKKGPKVHKSDLIEKYGSDKNAIIEQTLKYPAVLDEYRREKGRQSFLPLSHEDLESVEGDAPVDWDKLLYNVTSLPTGTDDASAYERAIEALLTALFYPDLVHPIYQHEIHDRRKRIDIKYTNMGRAGFFAWLSKHYTAPQVFVECKNYGGKVANPELDQLSGRFGRSRGNFGLLVCRKLDDKARFQTRCRDTAKDDRGFVIVIDDDDLETLVQSRKAGDEGQFREFSLLRERFEHLIS